MAILLCSPGRLRRALVLGVSLSLGCAAANARTWFVNPSAPPGRDGTAWAAAFASPTEALRVAATGDEVWCAAGTYQVSAALRPPSGIRIRGGFAGSESRPDERTHPLTSHATILHGVTPGGSVIVLDHVRNVVLDGLTLTGAVDAPALQIADSADQIEVRQCSVSNNTSHRSGAALALLRRSNATFLECKFAQNHIVDDRKADEAGADSAGAGIYVDATSCGSWTACVINENTTAGPAGGGVCIRSGAGLINRFVLCDFYFNEAGRNGSAIEAAGPLELRNCTICSNRARTAAPGAAVHVTAGRTTLSGMTYIVGNVSGDHGERCAEGLDGAENCAVVDNALVANETGPADPTLWGRRDDVHLTPRDLLMPPLRNEPPAAGKWVKQTLPSRQGTNAYHCLYLPADWQPGRKYPVLVGFPGNGPFRNRYGDRSGGLPEDNEMPYGLSGGRGYIVLSLGYLDSRHNLAPAQWWWGDVKATVAYCKDAVAMVCRDFGGDPSQVILTGFSRSAIGVSFVGLHDDTIARLWRAFICYDDWEMQKDMARDWYKFGKNSFNYDPADFGGTGVEQRFRRVAGRPVFILGARGEAKELNEKYHFPFTFVDKPHRNHNTSWSMRDTPEREQIRAWLHQVLSTPRF